MKTANPGEKGMKIRRQACEYSSSFSNHVLVPSPSYDSLLVLSLDCACDIIQALYVQLSVAGSSVTQPRKKGSCRRREAAEEGSVRYKEEGVNTMKKGSGAHLL